MAVKKAKDLTPGDRIDTEDGVKTVTANNPGVYVGHRRIEWRGGFGEIHRTDEVETV